MTAEASGPRQLAAKINHYVTVEVVTLLFCFTLPLLQFGLQDLLYEKLCLELQNNLTLCSNTQWVHRHRDIEGATSLYTMYCNIVVIIPSVINVLLMGSYIDRYGLQVPLLLPLIGCTVAFAFLAAIAWIPTLSYKIIFIPMLILGVTGNGPTIILAFITYAAKDSSAANRSIRIAIVMSCLSIAITIGVGLLGPINHGIGLPWVFLVSSIACLIAMVDVKFRLRPPLYGSEVSASQYQSDSWVQKLRYMLNLQTIKDYCKTLVKKRENGRRLHIYLMILVFVVSFCALMGVVDVEYLYLTKEKDFSHNEVSVFMSIATLLTFIGNILFVYVLNTRLGVNIIWIIAIGSFSSTICYIGLATASSRTVFWVTNAFRLTAGLTNVGCRAYVSSGVELGEQGIIMSLMATLEAVFKLIASLIFNGLYDVTLPVWPGLTLLLAAILCLLGVPVLAVVRFRDRKYEQYASQPLETLTEDEDPPDTADCEVLEVDDEVVVHDDGHLIMASY